MRLRAGGRNLLTLVERLFTFRLSLMGWKALPDFCASHNLWFRSVERTSGPAVCDEFSGGAVPAFPYPEPARRR
jgi:hypothetical protein